MEIYNFNLKLDSLSHQAILLMLYFSILCTKLSKLLIVFTQIQIVGFSHKKKNLKLKKTHYGFLTSHSVKLCQWNNIVL